MDYVILDLEWNTSFSNRRKKYVNEIIEFGAVKTDENMQIIDRFSMLITPQIGKKLSTHIQQLTHLTFDQLANANNTFPHVAKCFEKFLGNGVLLTWSTSDILTLIDNYNYYFHSERLPFLTKYCNLQSYCEKYLNKGGGANQLGLASCCEMLGIDKGELSEHRAADDAMLSFYCLKKIYDEQMLRSMTELALTDEFYKKITFKNRFITDINNPNVDKTVMYFDCPKCNKRLTRFTDWQVRGKNFAADFSCPQCSEEYSGKISFKLRYDETVVKKKIAAKKDIENNRRRIEEEKKKKQDGTVET